MSKKSTRNNDLLNSYKSLTSPKIYSLLVKLVNDDREDFAKLVLNIDYLLQYASTNIKQKDLKEAKECLGKAQMRINTLNNEGVDTQYLEYIFEGLMKKLH